MSRRYLMGLVVLLMLGGGFFWRGYGVGGQAGNRLGDEISPYLLLHAHNPVDWYPWGEEALARSRREQKPIFLSIGYATCYWCHVMERNVFSNPEIADLMNEHFINIKVDREERPDLDDLYMTATQLMTGSGGWPNSVFLTPELKPFYAGTYFPPEDFPGRPGFPGVVFGMSQTWTKERPKVKAYADRVTEAIRAIKAEAFVPDDSVTIDHGLVAQAVAQLTSRYDSQNAGFGGAPKFPQAMQLELLLRFYEHDPDPRILSIITHTLDTMANGGIYDHLGGGFHRYATDARWRVPHFEKMLYNQGDLSRLYLRAYEVTGNERYLRVGKRILDFVARDMLGPDGAFYSAIDSETDAVEGLSYLWTETEIRETLGDDTELFYWVYGLTPMPEGEGQVLYKISSAETAAAKVGMLPDVLRERLGELEARLLRRRTNRKSPLVDTKVVTAWNGLMVDAYAFSYRVTGENRYLEIATGAADFLLAELRTDSGDLMRTFREGTVKYRAYQEDYAYLARGLMRLHSVTGVARWQDAAVDLTDRMVLRFWDEQRGGFHFTDGADSLIVRTKNPFDAAMASGNAVAAHVLVGLARDTGGRTYHDRALSLFQTFAHEIKEDPGRFTHQVAALDDYLHADWPAILGALPTYGEIGFGNARMPPALSLQALNLAGPSAGRPVVHGSLDIQSVLPGAGQTFKVAIRLNIEDGWHINAVPATGQELIPTTVVFNSDQSMEVISIDYPGGQEIEFAFADESLSVYSGELVISAVVRFIGPLMKDDSSVLRAVVSFQACSDAVCLAPRELILSIPMAR